MQQSQEHSINCITWQKKHKTDAAAIHCTLLDLDLSISWNSVPHVKTGTAFSMFLSSMEVI